MCPFVECTTIASICMKVFCKNFLREEEIGIIPPGEYRYKDNHSHKVINVRHELVYLIIHEGRGIELSVRLSILRSRINEYCVMYTISWLFVARTQLLSNQS